jgi:hypothetical protein
MLLVPMLMFYLLWPNWGAALYGEVRGAVHGALEAQLDQ